MPGILPGISLINNFDANGELMRGALLRIYAAGTTSPVTAYKDSALTSGQEQPWPLAADSAARLPMFYLADGDYRVRLASSDGSYVAYDIPIFSSVGPSEGGGGGGGVSPQVIYQTGDLKARLGTGLHDGFVRVNGRTIGSSGSGATERANSDTQVLYEYLWNGFSDTVCPVSGGRGVSSTADFNANKQIALPDARGRTLFGADAMGATTAGRLTTATFANPDTVASSGGAESQAIAQTNLPAIKPSISIIDPGHGHSLNNAGNLVGATASGGGAAQTGSGQPSENVTVNNNTTGITAQFTSNLGSGTALPTASPGLVVTYYVKL